MTLVRMMMLIGFGIGVTVCGQPAWAQQAPSGTGQGQICDDRDPWNPSAQCQGQTRIDQRAGPNGHDRSGPLGPVERTTIPRDSDSVIALVPFELRQTTLPPVWLRVCRTNTANGAGYMWVNADQETARMAYPRCVYVAFKGKVSIGTSAGDEATVEYQFLGRR